MGKTVRRHTSKRVSSRANTGRTFPNPPRAVNRGRKEKGLRPHHCHVRVQIFDLKHAAINNPCKAVYGWLKTAISVKNAEYQRAKANVTKYEDFAGGLHGQKNENAKRLLSNFDGKRVEVEKEVDMLEKFIKRLQQAKSKMQHLLIDEVLTEQESDKGLSVGEKLVLVDRRIQPTMYNMYVVISEDDHKTGFDKDYGVHDGHDYIVRRLEQICQDDDKFSPVLELLSDK